MRRNWVFRDVEEPAIDRLTCALEIPPLIARLLIHRGASSPESACDFLCQELSSLAAPDRMRDLPKAVGLIRAAIRRREKILVVGDYDVDGLTSSAVLYRALRHLGGEAEVHIPHRVEEGYGLKSAVLEKGHRLGARLLITADCGTTSFEELEFARSLGLETIVVDHHDLEGGRRPPASAFLNPLQPGCGYPEKELASVGVAFTLARGLVPGTGTVPGTDFIFEHLDLVALGTIADVAPLTGENRILVRAGLHALRGTLKPGLRALIERVGLSGESLGADDVSFTLAPPINAMGRIGSAQQSFRLLVTEDREEAGRLARLVCQENKNRAAMERESLRQALARVTREVNFSRDRVIVLEDERWHPGVIGILAARLAHRFHRPAVVIALDGSVCRGSARSIRAFHLTEALHALRGHLLDFGGHPGAAGLTIRRDQIPAFREALNRLAHERLEPRMLTPLVEVDAEIPMAALTEELMRDLDALAPFGAANPRPVFVSRDARLIADAPRRGFNPWGIPLKVESAEGQAFDAFHPRDLAGDGLNLRRFRGPVHLAYSPVRRRTTHGLAMELRVRDLRLP